LEYDRIGCRRISSNTFTILIMLTIVNYKKIRNRWFGDWQIGKIIEDNAHYALQAFHKEGKRSITIVIFREDKIEGEYSEIAYNISLIDDIKGSSSIIEDIIYKEVLEDMELFGESLVHYLNTL
jgi:hypothetical protein